MFIQQNDGIIAKDLLTNLFVHKEKHFFFKLEKDDFLILMNFFKYFIYIMRYFCYAI